MGLGETGKEGNNWGSSCSPLKSCSAQSNGKMFALGLDDRTNLKLEVEFDTTPFHAFVRLEFVHETCSPTGSVELATRVPLIAKVDMDRLEVKEKLVELLTLFKLTKSSELVMSCWSTRT